MQRYFTIKRYYGESFFFRKCYFFIFCLSLRLWGEISVDFENGTAEITRLADWDTIKTNWFANEAIRYILSLSLDAFTEYMLVPLEPLLIS